MFKFDKKIENASNVAMKRCKEYFEKVEANTEYNQQKVLKAFIENGVSENHFSGSTGYGYDDKGREILDKVYTSIFKAEDALVRYNFVSGTHALTVALFGVLRPGDKILSVTGLPYDTMQGVIGLDENKSGSLKEFGIEFEYVDMLEDGNPDYNLIESQVNEEYKLIYIQRSRGYSLRKSLSISDIKKLVNIIKKRSPNSIIMVDNCYGEFVEKQEPTECGVDLVVGSMIKNPGGGIAPTGGYIVGKSKYIEMCSYRLTTPCTGKEIGATLGHNRELFMGTFNAPHVVGEALKTAIFTASLFENLGYEVFPKACEERTDIVQSVKLGSPERLVSFCQGLQKGSPVDSFVLPEPWDMPGYDNKVIMAAGTFTLGSSIEISADAPLRPPYAVWLQGGLNFHSAKIAVLSGAQHAIRNV